MNESKSFADKVEELARHNERLRILEIIRKRTVGMYYYDEKDKAFVDSLYKSLVREITEAK